MTLRRRNSHDADIARLSSQRHPHFQLTRPINIVRQAHDDLLQCGFGRHHAHRLNRKRADKPKIIFTTRRYGRRILAGQQVEVQSEQHDSRAKVWSEVEGAHERKRIAQQCIELDRRRSLRIFFQQQFDQVIILDRRHSL